jgi:starch synthase (maltosyl-transferring)
MIQGKQRVLIEQVQPVVDNGDYPAKRTIGESVDVSASLLADGHDHLKAHVLFRKKADKDWQRVSMIHSHNDEWRGSFMVDQTGSYLFAVEAWVDHLDTWYSGIRKKIEAKVDVKIELIEGAIFLQQLSGGTEQSLIALAQTLKNEQFYARALTLVMSNEFQAVVAANPMPENVTISGEFEIIVEHKKALFSAWYEFFPRSSALQGLRHGTFQDCIKLLPRIFAMGFDVLYFPPIHPIGRINRKGKNNSVRASKDEPGSPWAIGSEEGGHKSILPELGTMDDFQRLIQEAKKFNIDIALDIAFQCAPDHPYVKDHPGWFKQRPDGSIQYAENPPKKYQDIYPFNFENENWKELWDELKSVIVFWIEKGITIFRIDNPHTKPIRFWEWVIREVNKDHRDIIFLAEAFTRPKIMSSLGKVGFTQSYTYFTWRSSKQELIDYVNELVYGPSRNYFRPNFWPNTPDILPYHLQHQGENSFILRFALAATLSSNYGIYGPPYEFCENTPMDGKEEYLNSEKYEIRHYDWRGTNRMTDIISLVNRARKENVALQSTWNVQFLPIENPNLIAYLKTSADLSNIILVVVTLDAHTNQSGYVQLPKSTLKLHDKINVKLHDLITEENYTWTQEWNYVELNPDKMPFHLFRLQIRESNM